MKQKMVTDSQDDRMKDVSFEDFEEDNNNIIFLKTDGTIVEKEQMFLNMGGTLPD